MKKNLQEAFKRQKKQTKKEVLQISGTLGIAIGGQKRVEVPTRNSFVYVKLRDNQNEVIQAFNNQVAPSYGLPVIVERQSNRYVVVSVDTLRYQNNWNSFAPFLPRHGNTHSMDFSSGGGGDIVWVHSRQFMPSLIMPSGSTGGPNVIMNSYTLKNADGTWKYTGNTGTPNLVPYNPASGTMAVMALVYLDSVSGNPGLLINSGTYFSSTITGSSAIVPYIPTLTNSNYIPLAAIRLVSGTSQISWDNIYDVRQFLHVITTGSSGGGGGTGTNYDDTYLRLDTSNDPLTGRLTIQPGADTTVLQALALGDATALELFQTPTPSGTLTAPGMDFGRVEDSGNEILDVAFINLSQTWTLGNIVNGKLISFESNSIERMFVDPSAQGTGTNAMFDGDFTLSTGGNLLLLKNAGTPKFRVDAAGYIELGLDVAKEDNAGKIGYHLFGSDYLDIVGAGTSGGNRWVRIFDNLKVDTHLQTSSFQNLGLLNHFVYLNATGTFVAPSNAVDHTSITGSYSILGLDNNLNSVRFSVNTVLGGRREALTASRTYYVRTDGNNSNSGLVNSAGGAFLTIQKAVDTIATLDINGQTVTVQVADGTYTGTVTLKNVTGFSAAGDLVIQGNSGTPANVVISTTSANCFTASGLSSIWDIKDMKLQTSTAGSCLVADSGAFLRFGNINFGATATYHISASGGIAQALSNYSITGGATRHWSSTASGRIFVQGRTVTLTGTPAFTVFAFASTLSLELVNANTYSGAATGQLYNASTNGVIFSGATLPGNVGGATSTGGQYV